ncbi:hypothetical protein [Burkholderia gladioli]|uniref:hypothetical protein n=1 Tax=Burkholderia gladioli TaxID=28095 RepID=UPI0016407053|nr:hypothetical protein [Burkholderia gladioli]
MNDSPGMDGGNADSLHYKEVVEGFHGLREAASREANRKAGATAIRLHRIGPGGTRDAAAGPRLRRPRR